MSFFKLKNIMLDRFEDFLLPLLLAMTFFYITRKIYLGISFEYAIIFLGVVIVMLLRSLNSKIHKLIS